MSALGPTPHPPRSTGLGARAGDLAARVRRRVLRHRRGLAALLVAGAVLAGLRSLAPPVPPTTTVGVAARDLPGGHVLGAADLVTIALPEGAVPVGVVDGPSALGRTLAAPLRRGEVLTDVRIAGSGLTRSLVGDAVAVPVRLTDAAQAALLVPGDLIDVVAAVGDPALGVAASADGTAVATCARVLAVPASDPAHGAAGLPGRLVVLEVRAGEARRAGVASATSYVTFSWCRR